MRPCHEIEREILELVKEYYESRHGQGLPFVPGDTPIPYAGRVFDAKEMQCLVKSALEFWLTAGTYVDQFEKDLAGFLGVKYCSAVNSGSSANLLAFMALTVEELGERRIKRGDEVITVAAGFPTTVAPIVQYGAIPVFVDVELETYNIDCAQLKSALSEKTSAVMLAHTLGNPFDIATVKEFCREHDLWLIEDNCDALGSKYRGQYTGTYGDIATSSFYPAHHITTGEGGAVYTNNPLLHKIVNSLRDWGRDCTCPSGYDNTCKNRFSRQFKALPYGYDHKYVYSHFGYNLKMTEMQAAIGCAQMEKLPDTIAARKRNWQALRTGLAQLSDQIILPEPTPESDPSWFGFVMTVIDQVGLSRSQIIDCLESRGIQTRMLFAGNLTKHPCFDEMRRTRHGFRVVSELKNTDIIMNQTFWVGVYPGISHEMVEYVVSCIFDYCSTSERAHAYDC